MNRGWTNPHLHRDYFAHVCIETYHEPIRISHASTKIPLASTSWSLFAGGCPPFLGFPAVAVVDCRPRWTRMWKPKLPANFRSRKDGVLVVTDGGTLAAILQIFVYSRAMGIISVNLNIISWILAICTFIPRILFVGSFRSCSVFRISIPVFLKTGRNLKGNDRLPTSKHPFPGAKMLVSGRVAPYF